MTGWIWDTIRVFYNCAKTFFVAYLVVYSAFMLLAVIVGVYTLYRQKQRTRLKNVLEENYYVPVSIIVPAYNEELTVVETVRSLLNLDYKVYEIIVVDDGSKDRTSQILIDTFKMQPVFHPIRRQVECHPEEFVYTSLNLKMPLTLIRKRNGGKADALNMGINASQFPYFICIDADSILQHDSLREIVRPVLEDDRVVAVGGSIRPCNDMDLENGRVTKYRLPRKLFACMQVLEYDRSFSAARILFDKFNGSLIISGAFGLFKKETVIACGGYDRSNIGEDMELVIKLHEFCRSNALPYRIRYATEAICWTQVPERLRDLGTQRRRWQIGLFQSMVSHRSMLNASKCDPASLISSLYFLLYELLSPYIELLGILTVILAFFVDRSGLPFIICFLAIYALLNSVLSMTAFFSRIQTSDLSVSFSDGVKAVLLCLLESTFLRLILTFVRATAFRNYRKRKLQWGKIERRKINLK